ncbi:MAG: ATP-dependent metallopeptidase FtsH/Yme1/Tma family protein [Pseudomonadales bacterium]|nr:ATP-dependent metallopeptidase FtsH/Yme1/Tma family protein [Pseudomonadales bacterium]
MNDMAKNLLLWLVIAVILVSIFANFSPVKDQSAMAYSDFVASVQQGRVQSVKINGQDIIGVMSSGERFDVVRPMLEDPQLINDLLEHNVAVEGVKPEKQSIWMQLLVASFPILIIIAVFMFFMRQMQGGAGGGKGGPMSFGKSKARLVPEDQIKTTFGDVAGCDEAKEEVQEVVDFLRDPGKYQRLGGKIPRGLLLTGPPGTGKTLLAKAVAGEAKVPFFAISGSDFVEMFVGVGASRVRDMFETAKKHSPCIIFIDEIDAVGRHRGGGMGGGHDEREQTLNQLLVEMDGFESNDGVIVIAATNRADVLDTALLRPGRFDRQVVVGLPDIRGREQILKVHMRKVPLADDVVASVLARGTPGFSGAELANLINEAALFAAKGNKRVVAMEEMEKARDKIMMGAERKSMVMSEKEKENTAYHESGHAIVGWLMPEHDPIHKVTIIPRGRALGVTMYLPEEDKISESKRYLIGRICSLYGGRIAEEMILGVDGVTTGAMSDIEHATKMVRAMITRWGLSDVLGPLLYTVNEMGKDEFSSATGEIIDSEMRKIIDECYEKARKILMDNVDILHAMKSALMEFETLDSGQVDDLMNRREVRPPKGWDGGAPPAAKDGDEEKKSDDSSDDAGVADPAVEH